MLYLAELFVSIAPLTRLSVTPMFSLRITLQPIFTVKSFSKPAVKILSLVYAVSFWRPFDKDM